MKFCSNCQSLLYPREHAGQLVMYCRQCGSDYPAVDHRVYLNRIIRSPNELTTVYQDVASDPTLPHAEGQTCKRCNQPGPLYFQASRDPDSGMRLYFVCANRDCGYRWTD